mmetsp:Transcript_20348/g.22528  ORF Transcript_20348/g.22528 Transcript_20348/m.22528 type:complete len:81 (-) Transcript_20348:344-586(-)
MSSASNAAASNALRYPVVMTEDSQVSKSLEAEYPENGDGDDENNLIGVVLIGDKRFDESLILLLVLVDHTGYFSAEPASK